MPPVGKLSTMRSTDVAAELVCRVPKTRWPVSAAEIGELHRFQVAHFADQDHVRVFAQGGAQGVREGLGVHAQFALVDDGHLVRVQVLNRVFNRDDMLGAVDVDVVDHRRQRRGLARTRSAPSPESGRAWCGSASPRSAASPCLPAVGILVGNQTQGGGDAAFVLEDVDAEAGASCRSA